MTDFSELPKKWRDQAVMPGYTDDSRQTLYECANELDEAIAQHKPAPPDGTWELTLNKYQRDNLMWLIGLCGYPYPENEPIGDFPLANTGDWLGEVYNPLAPGGDVSPNISRQSVQDRIDCSHEISRRLIGDLTRRLDDAQTYNERLLEAIRALYYAGVWTCDRDVDEAALWTAVRDAAGFPPGQSPKPGAPPKVVVSDRIKQIQADPSGDRTRRALEKQLNALEGGVVVSDEARERAALAVARKFVPSAVAPSSAEYAAVDAVLAALQPEEKILRDGSGVAHCCATCGVNLQSLSERQCAKCRLADPGRYAKLVARSRQVVADWRDERSKTNNLMMLKSLGQNLCGALHEMIGTIEELTNRTKTTP